MNTNPRFVDARENAIVGARGVSLTLTDTAVMGIVNVTPDSFSDGGLYAESDAAIQRALAVVAEGARIVDIGGESTRPGAAPVTVETELERVIPIVEGVRARSGVFISVDTSKPEVARAAIDAGADMINDVRGFEAPGALEAVAETGAATCVMHMRGEPRTMQKQPVYDDVVVDVARYLERRVEACRGAGIGAERLCIDPGFGFGKTLAHNLSLLRGLRTFVDSGYPVLVGVSRKSMFAKLFERDDRAARINGSLGAAFWAQQCGARIIRAHDVRETYQILTLAQALGQGIIS